MATSEAHAHAQIHSNPDADEMIDDIEKNKDVAAFSYILIFAPLLLISRRDSAFIKHHSLQALYLGFFFVLFMVLPGKMSYVNIVVVAAGLMGFLEAQAGHYYKMPIISDMIVHKITLERVYSNVKNGIIRIADIIKRMFTDGPGFAIRGTAAAVSKVRGIDVLKVNTQVQNLQNTLMSLQHNTAFLERELLLEKYLKKGSLPELSEVEKKELLEVQTAFKTLSKKIEQDSHKNFVSWKTSEGEILAGIFSANSFWIFFHLSAETFSAQIKNLPKEKLEQIAFGNWQGVEITAENFVELFPTIQELGKKCLLENS